MDASDPEDPVLRVPNNLWNENFLLDLVTFMQRPRLMPRLEEWGLANIFGAIIIPEGWPKFKPSPKPFLKAVEELGLLTASCCSIGDESVDMMGAPELRGLHAMGIAQGIFSEEELKKSGTEIITQSLTQLPSILKEAHLPSSFQSLRESRMRSG